MARQFWMTTGATVVVAGVLGLGLGSFATTTPHAPVRDAAVEQSAYADSYAPSTPSGADQAGPVVVRCTGCGPTLADRQWHANMGKLYPDAPDMDAMIDPPASSDMTYDEPVAQPLPDTDHSEPTVQPVMVNRTIRHQTAPAALVPDRMQESGERPLS